MLTASFFVSASVNSLTKNPSNSRTPSIWAATAWATSIGSSTSLCLALIKRIAVLNSKSAGPTSTINPAPNRLLKRSSNLAISVGGLSEVITTCPPSPPIALKVWKNSSCTEAFPAINCTSSINRALTLRYLART